MKEVGGDVWGSMGEMSSYTGRDMSSSSVDSSSFS
jgi:hypothetical protein